VGKLSAAADRGRKCQALLGLMAWGRGRRPGRRPAAVCLLPGTELAFAAPIRFMRLGWITWKPRVVNHTGAIFRQINKDNPRMHHDALEFPDGQMVLLTDVFEGQEATVLQRPAQPITAADIKAKERIPTCAALF
jgi:hypothetical protein